RHGTDHRRSHHEAPAVDAVWSFDQLVLVVAVVRSHRHRAPRRGFEMRRAHPPVCRRGLDRAPALRPTRNGCDPGGRTRSRYAVLPRPARTRHWTLVLGYAASADGSSNSNVAPPSGSFAAEMVPSCIRRIDRTMESPMPIPVGLVV